MQVSTGPLLLLCSKVPAGSLRSIRRYGGFIAKAPALTCSKDRECLPGVRRSRDEEAVSVHTWQQQRWRQARRSRTAERPDLPLHYSREYSL